MKYYSSGEFAGKAHITKKTVRYYDEHGILKPSYVNEHGARFYSEEDFARLQQVLFLKYIGFSLADIKEMNVRSGDRHFLSESLHMQLGLLDERIEQRFGRENGGALLGGCFEDVEWWQHDDCLLVTEAEPLIEYVLSCHGNQNRFIVDKYKEFKAFVRKRTDAAGGFRISKDAEVFVAR